MWSLCYACGLIKRGQKGVFPKMYTNNSDRLLIFLCDWKIIKINSQEKKFNHGVTQRGLRGGTIYVITVHKWPHPLRPLWVTLWPQFLSCELIFIILQSYIKIMGLSQSLVRILGQPPFNPLLLRGKYCIEFTCWSQPQFSSNFKKKNYRQALYT